MGGHPFQSIQDAARCASWPQVDAGLWWIWSCLTLFYAARLAQHVLHVWLHWQSSAFGLYLRPLPEAGSEAAPLLGAGPAKMDIGSG